MIDYDTDRICKAVQFLIKSSYFRHHVTKLRNSVSKPRALPFKNESESLNELLVVGRQNELAMENLIAVAEQRRGTKTDYQRAFMANKRRRDRKVVDLKEIYTGKKIPREIHNERVKAAFLDC